MTGLAGWLFADLLLVLFITAFASATIPSTPPKPPAPVHGSPHPAPKPSPHKPVLILHPVKFQLRVPPGIAGSSGHSHADLVLVGELKNALRAKGWSSSRAGLVEAFGWSPSPDGDGTQVAKAADQAVTANLTRFRRAYQQNFWKAGADGMVTFKVFFFAHSG
jgi:hypothetical protein